MTLPKHSLRSKSKSTVSPLPRKSAPAQMPAAKAKAHLLELLDTVDSTRASVIITKRGRPVARIVPIEQTLAPDIFGCMKGTGQITGDIVSPEPDLWEAMVE